MYKYTNIINFLIEKKKKKNNVTNILTKRYRMKLKL